MKRLGKKKKRCVMTYVDPLIGACLQSRIAQHRKVTGQRIGMSALLQQIIVEHFLGDQTLPEAELLRQREQLRRDTEQFE